MKEKTIDMANLLREISMWEGPDMAGRDIGRSVREALAASFAQEEGETAFFLDFRRVGVIDYSCADEMLGKLIPRVLADEFGSKYLCLVDLSPAQMENIGVALERRGLAVAATLRRGGWTFLGKLNPYLRETFRIVYDFRHISARELSHHLSLALNAGSTRLLNLYKQRLVGRRENLTPQGFREYIYESFDRGFGIA